MQEISQEYKEFTPKGSRSEQKFLEGPRSRWQEFNFLLRIFREFIYGFRKLHFTGPCITVFGSARFAEQNPYYQLARQMGQEIARLGFAVMTGGGPGIMEAANRGAREAGGISIGCNIILPKEQHPNPYLDKWVTFDHFFIRKVLLSKYSYGFVVMPGGYGTLDEFFEALTLIQTGKFKRFPVVLMGTEFHRELYAYLRDLAKGKTIDALDLNLFLLTDSVPEAVEHLRKNAIDQFKLTYKPQRLLFEKRVRRKTA
jgi:uncharacterized protein (TIGR00730 family)